MYDADSNPKAAQHIPPPPTRQSTAATTWRPTTPWLVLGAWLLLALGHIALIRRSEADYRTWFELLRVLQMSLVGLTVAAGSWLAAWPILARDTWHVRLLYVAGGALSLVLIAGIRFKWHTLFYLGLFESFDAAVYTATGSLFLFRRGYRLGSSRVTLVCKSIDNTPQFAILDLLILTFGVACVLAMQLMPVPGARDHWYGVALPIVVATTTIVGQWTRKPFRFVVVAFVLAVFVGLAFRWKLGGAAGYFAFGSLVSSVDWSLAAICVMRSAGGRIAKCQAS